MDNPAITLTVACVFSALVLVLPPVHALTVFLASVIWYPSYYTVPMGTIDWTVRRIVILAVLAKAFLTPDLFRQFKLIRLDKFVIALFVCETIAGLATAKEMESFLEYQSGQAFDMLLPYFAVRLLLVRKEYYLSLLRGILVISSPFAVLAFYQFLTGGNPVSFMREYHGARRSIGYRAELTFDVSIMMGLYFISLGAACAGVVRTVTNYRAFYVVAVILMGIGAISSSSSGPILALLMASGFMVLYRWRQEWKLVLTVVILMCGTVEIISNRHFYDVLGGLTLQPETAWYRSRLMDVAFAEGGMSGHWLLGFGIIDPGWGPTIDGRSHTDIVNHYILILANYGLLGFIPFALVNWEAARSLWWAGKRALSRTDEWMIWALAAALFGLAGAFFSVSLFGPPTTMYYMLIAFAGAMPAFVLESYPPAYRALAAART